MRCLVADDDLEMRRWLRAVLARVAHRIDEAATGWEALFVLAESGPYDLVVADVRMPMPDGVTVAEMSRAAGVITPFIVMTAFGDDDVRASVAALDRAVFLDKPFDAHDLLRAVVELGLGSHVRKA